MSQKCESQITMDQLAKNIVHALTEFEKNKPDFISRWAEMVAYERVARQQLEPLAKLAAENAHLKAIAARMVKTKDGVPVGAGDVVYEPAPREPWKYEVRDQGDGPYAIRDRHDGEYDHAEIGDCYFHEQAAAKAWPTEATR